MKSVLLLSISLALAATQISTDLDLDAILGNRDVTQSYLNCLLEDQACDQAQANLKKELSELIEDMCAKCTTAQKNMYLSVLGVLEENYANEFNALLKKFDPDSNTYNSFLDSLANV